MPVFFSKKTTSQMIFNFSVTWFSALNQFINFMLIQLLSAQCFFMLSWIHMLKQKFRMEYFKEIGKKWFTKKQRNRKQHSKIHLVSKSSPQNLYSPILFKLMRIKSVKSYCALGHIWFGCVNYNKQNGNKGINWIEKSESQLKIRKWKKNQLTALCREFVCHRIPELKSESWCAHVCSIRLP